MPHLIGVHHLSLSVTDRAVSTAWYSRVFGFRAHSEVESATFTRTRLRHPTASLTLTLTQHATVGDDRFDPQRVGLDHLALQVGSLGEVHGYAELLDQLGVEHAPVTLHGDPPQSALVAFRDPDGIQLEVFAVEETLG
ncbi:VOC family protein [soil metagenome]